METKICSTCHRELPVENFWRNRHTKDGLQPSCKECHYNCIKASKERKKKEYAKANAEVVPPPECVMYNLAEIEKQTIIRCLNENPEKRLTDYADLLGISERTFYRKINAYGLHDIVANVRSFSKENMEKCVVGDNLVKVRTLSDYDARELLEELWRRGYDGHFWMMVRKECTLSKLFGNRGKSN